MIPKKIKRFLPYGRQSLDKNDVNSVLKVLKSNFITQGPEIINFEKAFAKYVGAKYAVACATGTAALHLSCLSLGINSKSKILTTPITFVASANCAEFLGANINLIDIDSSNHCISASELEKKLKKEKKIDLVIPVHLAGQSADMEKIYRLKKKYKFKIIEDSCHALGGEYNKFKVGSCRFSDLSTFSFHPVKPITTAEGGMITTNNKKIYEKLLLFRTHGITKNPKNFINKRQSLDNKGNVNRWYYEMLNLGYNYRLTDIQAALGHSQLKKIDKFTQERIKIAKRYDAAFKNNNLISILDITSNTKHAYHLYTLLINFKGIGKSRNEVMKELADFNIGTQVLYIPIYHQPYYKIKYKFKSKDFKNSESYYQNALSIPIFPGLKKSEQNFIISKINDIVS